MLSGPLRTAPSPHLKWTLLEGKDLVPSSLVSGVNV